MSFPWRRESMGRINARGSAVWVPAFARTTFVSQSAMQESANNLKDIETKLGAARTRLILEKPFIGALVMHLPLTPADPAWCETVAADARAFHFNPDYIAGLDFPQTQFVLAHEAMHCAPGHFARRSHRTRRRWDVAPDHAVNLLLLDEGLKPPPGALG